MKLHPFLLLPALLLVGCANQPEHIETSWEVPTSLPKPTTPAPVKKTHQRPKESSEPGESMMAEHQNPYGPILDPSDTSVWEGLVPTGPYAVGMKQWLMQSHQ